MKKILLTLIMGLFILGTIGTAHAIVLTPGTGPTATLGGTAGIPGVNTFVTSITAPFSFGLEIMTGSVTRQGCYLLFWFAEMLIVS